MRVSVSATFGWNLNNLILCLRFFMCKTTFHGFPHPLLEDMLAQTAAARKKMPPNKAHVTVDVGRYLAQAYGLGLASGAQ